MYLGLRGLWFKLCFWESFLSPSLILYGPLPNSSVKIIKNKIKKRYVHVKDPGKTELLSHEVSLFKKEHSGCHTLKYQFMFTLLKEFPSRMRRRLCGDTLIIVENDPYFQFQWEKSDWHHVLFLQLLSVGGDFLWGRLCIEAILMWYVQLQCQLYFSMYYHWLFTPMFVEHFCNI